MSRRRDDTLDSIANSLIRLTEQNQERLDRDRARDQREQRALLAQVPTEEPLPGPDYVTKSGKVLTNAQIEAWAEEAELGYDTSRRTNMGQLMREVAGMVNIDPGPPWRLGTWDKVLDRIRAGQAALQDGASEPTDAEKVTDALATLTRLGPRHRVSVTHHTTTHGRPTDQWEITAHGHHDAHDLQERLDAALRANTDQGERIARLQGLQGQLARFLGMNPEFGGDMPESRVRAVRGRLADLGDPLATLRRKLPPGSAGGRGNTPWDVLAAATAHIEDLDRDRRTERERADQAERALVAQGPRLLTLEQARNAPDCTTLVPCSPSGTPRWGRTVHHMDHDTVVPPYTAEAEHMLAWAPPGGWDPEDLGVDTDPAYIDPRT